MKWKTAISEIRDGTLYIRGKSLTELIGMHTFAEVIFLLLVGKQPSDVEVQMLDAVLVSMVDHTVAVPSGFVPRVVVSTGNSMNAALAAGVLAVGDYHGGALEGAMQVLQEAENPKQYVADQLLAKRRVAGFGHKVYKNADPRAEQLFAVAGKLGFDDMYLTRAKEIERELQEQSGKQLPLNVDGTVAAILVTLGFDYHLGKAFFILGRMPGMIAHAYEELKNEKPFRRFDDRDIEYVGD